MVHVCVAIGAPVKLTHVAAGLNPEPDTWTVVPAGPELGLKIIVGPSTVNVAEAESVAGLPVAVMTYALGATAATTNEAVRTPPDTEHVKLEIEPVSLNVQVVSPVEKPEPDTLTVDPT